MFISDVGEFILKKFEKKEEKVINYNHVYLNKN